MIPTAIFIVVISNSRRERETRVSYRLGIEKRIFVTCLQHCQFIRSVKESGGGGRGTAVACNHEDAKMEELDTNCAKRIAKN